MKRDIISNALNDISDDYLQEAIDELYAPKIRNARWEKHKMKRKNLYRAACAVAVLAVAGVGTVAYAKGVFGIRHRKPVSSESYTTTWVDVVDGEEYEATYDDLEYVFEFEGPEVCQEVEFKEGWLPFSPNEEWNAESKNASGYRTYLSSEFSSGDDLDKSPAYILDVYYLPQLVDGEGAMIFLGMEPSNITETQEGEFRIIQFHASGTEAYAGCEANYVMKINEEKGYCIAIRGSADIKVLKHIADELDIRETGKVLNKSDLEGENVILLDIGRG